ncbi:hypothetical protein B0H14DRAFT_2575367 [Mycena olivaceomarginata]|nr:hypothetical protein B0H14DRAFT_2575367 [Mycena olivaceomarginata]
MGGVMSRPGGGRKRAGRGRQGPLEVGGIEKLEDQDVGSGMTYKKGNSTHLDETREKCSQTSTSHFDSNQNVTGMDMMPATDSSYCTDQTQVMRHQDRPKFDVQNDTHFLAPIITWVKT